MFFSLKWIQSIKRHLTSWCPTDWPLFSLLTFWLTLLTSPDTLALKDAGLLDSPPPSPSSIRLDLPPLHLSPLSLVAMLEVWAVRLLSTSQIWRRVSASLYHLFKQKLVQLCPVTPDLKQWHNAMSSTEHTGSNRYISYQAPALQSPLLFPAPTRMTVRLMSRHCQHSNNWHQAVGKT